MTRREVIEAACAITALVYHSRGDYARPSDGFCDRCREHQTPAWTFQHAGHTLRYVLAAVCTQLECDGVTPSAQNLDEVRSLLGIKGNGDRA